MRHGPDHAGGMLMTSARRVVLAAVFATAGMVVAQAQSPGDWAAVGHDPGGMKYSPLTQITPGNVSTLSTAWTYDLGIPASGYTVTPIVAGNVMYLPVQSHDRRAQSGHGHRIVEVRISRRSLSSEPIRLPAAAEFRTGRAPPQAPARIVIATTNGFLLQLEREDRASRSPDRPRHQPRRPASWRSSAAATR